MKTMKYSCPVSLKGGTKQLLIGIYQVNLWKIYQMDLSDGLWKITALMQFKTAFYLPNYR